MEHPAAPRLSVLAGRQARAWHAAPPRPAIPTLAPRQRQRLASTAPVAAALAAALAAARRQRRRRGRGRRSSAAAAAAGGGAEGADDAAGTDQDREALRLPVPPEADGRPGPGVRIAAAAAYLLPLVDGVDFGIEFAQQPALTPFFLAMENLNALVSLIPFGTTVFLVLLPVVASNRELPRLLRFSLWQALVMEVVLQVPTLIAAAISFILGGLDDEGDEILTISGVGSTMDLGTFTGAIDGPLDPPLWADSAIFALLAATVLYGVVKALLGEEAEGVPFVSDVARAPTDSL